MDFLSRKIKKIIAYSGVSLVITLGIIWGVWSCSSSNTSSQETQQDSLSNAKKENTQLAGISTIPPQLDNFDKSFRGTIPSVGSLQINLRRYGSELSGKWWTMSKLENQDIKGKIEADNQTIHLILYNAQGDVLGNMSGKIDEGQIKANWNAAENNTGIPVVLQVDESKENYKIKIDELELNRKSSDNKQSLKITYPVLLGIPNEYISNKVNQVIEKYFESKTLVDSIDKVTYPFSEDVKFEITFLANEFISICKHHHLSKNNDTQLFDDSHGININFKRGKQYELRDLFNANAFEQLNAVIQARISKSCGGALTPEQLEACRVKPEENTSFSLSKDKITFHLTERLPYKLRGCGYVKISYQDLAVLFNPSGPLAEIMQ